MDKNFYRNSMCAALVLVFLLAIAARAEPEGSSLAVITVEAGKHERRDTPVWVDLPSSLNARGPLRLVEVDGDRRIPVPAQVEAGSPPRLSWILEGRTSPLLSRHFELLSGPPVKAKGVSLNMTASTLQVSLGGQKIFDYNHAHVLPPEGKPPAYIRSAYIHPLFSPSGRLITEDFPSDHLHHKGIWFPWTSTEFEGHHVDFWNLGKEEGTVQFAGFEAIESGPVFGQFRARHEFLDLTQGKVALHETWQVRVWAVGGPRSGRWLFDLTSTQRCASASPLLLNKYRYGGLGFRGAREWKGDNYVLLTSEDKTKADGHTTRAKWCAHSGAIEGQWTTVVILCHSGNDRFPEPMRIWPKNGAFFCYSPVQAGDWTLEPGKEYVFRYRFLVYEGKIDKTVAESAWQDFGDPPRVELRTP